MSWASRDPGASRELDTRLYRTCAARALRRGVGRVDADRCSVGGMNEMSIPSRIAGSVDRAAWDDPPAGLFGYGGDQIEVGVVVQDGEVASLGGGGHLAVGTYARAALAARAAAQDRRSRTARRKPVGELGRRVGRLVDAGALYRIRKGEYAYTAPKFRDYLLRRAGRAAAGRHSP